MTRTACTVGCVPCGLQPLSRLSCRVHGNDTSRRHGESVSEPDVSPEKDRAAARDVDAEVGLYISRRRGLRSVGQTQEHPVPGDDDADREHEREPAPSPGIYETPLSEKINSGPVEVGS